MNPHIIVHALAGTGKTFTLVQGINRLRGQEDLHIVPSYQQFNIWDKFGIEEDSSAICFAAFSAAIRDELLTQIPDNLHCDVLTMHSMGYRAIRNEVGMSGNGVTLDKKKVEKIISKECNGASIYSLNQSRPGYVSSLKRLVEYSKYTGCIDPSDQHLSVIAAYYDIPLLGHIDSLFNATRITLTSCLKQLDTVDFNDMPWVPVVLNLPMKQYDTLLLDEVQDLNYCQQQLALQSSQRIIAVGDEHQAIYGFAGADTQSMNTMQQTLTTGYLNPTERVLHDLPLTISYRCSHAIAEEACKIVPNFKANVNNVVGSVTTSNLDNVQSGDMVLCRVNAPLLRIAFTLAHRGLSVKIIGRDIQASMKRLVDSLNATFISDLENKARRSKDKEVLYLKSQKHIPESAVLACADKYNCLIAICREVTSISAVYTTIITLFSDNKVTNCIRLSSIHRAKGLEATNVYIIRPDLLPHPMAKTDWQVEQEMNLKYVAITRAKENLIWIEG